MSGRSASLRLGELAIDGWSRAGEETWFRVSPPGLAFDVGRGPLALAGVRDLFVTHGHLDHLLGLPYLLSRRALDHPWGRRVFCPAEIAEDVAALVKVAERLERTEYPFTLCSLSPGDRVEVGRDLAVEAFATEHVVPSLGYHLLRRRHRLREELRELPAEEVVARKRSGEAVEERVEERWLSFCGDTGPGVFERQPELFSSRVLMLECTFLDPDHRERAGRFGHLHLADLAAREERFENEAVVLYHLSRRHRPEELRREVDQWMPRLAGRVHVLLGA
ncbi:MAG: MBL fold metallo-hydrolase [Thermoanaerobaculia bacterium]|nr:MBL fold metallo-hydrolase [Thermoanaerobaculia bacterium]